MGAKEGSVIDHLERALRHPKKVSRENEFLKCHNDDKYDFDVINSTTKAHST